MGSVEIVELQLFFQKRAISIERMGGSEKSALRLSEISSPLRNRSYRTDGAGHGQGMNRAWAGHEQGMSRAWAGPVLLY